MARPRKFKSPEELDQKIEEYFNWSKDNNKHITVSGLAWYLDTNRQTLIEYQNMNGKLYKNLDSEVKDRYSDTIKRAKARIEMECEELLYNRSSVVGAIFSLKNNYKWVDKHNIEQSNKEIKIELI